MKLAKIRILTGYNAIIGALLAILGFGTSCIPEVRCEYGTPSAKFIVSGKVVSSETNLPVQNVRVVMKRDTTFTNALGEYQVTDKYSFPTSQTYSVKFQDIRGETLRQYSDLDTIVEFKNPVFVKGEGHWYKGEAEKEIDVKLKPKK
jgi:putative lipoprotein (rSAM/lipoprotein system)